jgi:hypothetical protein
MKDREARVLTEQRIKPMASAAVMATSFVRSMAIKPYQPGLRARETALLEREPALFATRSRLFREKGSGTIPTIVLGGFVPDATETVEFQRKMLQQHGPIYYLNYPRNGFSRPMFQAQLSDLIDDLARSGRKPLILSVSFGSGLLLDYLRTASAETHQAIRGVILASPVICTEDLIRGERQKGEGLRLLESTLKKIVTADPGDERDVQKHIERARRCFQSLFNAGAGSRPLSFRHLSIRKKIFDVIEHTSPRGGFERVLALQDFAFPRRETTLFDGPVLVLLAENEEDILVPSSPTLRLFRDAGSYSRIFPRCRVKTVRSERRDDGVAHASLIFHHDAYNTLINDWYEKTLYPRLQLAV